jgi:hypothetical protein
MVVALGMWAYLENMTIYRMNKMMMAQKKKRRRMVLHHDES